MFQCLVSQVYLNLVVAIIVDAFTGVSSAQKLPVDENLIDKFVQIWHKYDPHATYFIKIDNLQNLLEDLVKCPESDNMFVTVDKNGFSQKQIERLII